jgi:predicted transcriptional regulator
MGVEMAKRDVDARIVVAVVQGLTRSEIAELAGISERTLRRRLKEPSLMAAVAESRAQVHAQVLGRLQQMASRALTEVEAVLTTGDPATRLRAARLVLEQCSSFRGASDDARLAAMEAAQARSTAEREGKTWKA